MIRFLLILFIQFIVGLFCFSINAIEKQNKLFSINDCTLLGIGAYNVRDTYLSELNYTGWGVRILNERMKITKLMNSNVSRQQSINVEFSITKNPARNVKDYTGFIDYTLAYHYQFQPINRFKLLVGPAVRLLGGFVYNTRNGNNPASAKADLDLGVSALALYNLKVKNTNITLRYQFQLPLLGMLFSPHYGQPYYFIFIQGDNNGVVNFSSLHNKFVMKNYITADIPFPNCTLRFGYLNSMYRLNVQNIKSHFLSNSFVIGFVKEFVAFRGKKSNNSNLYKSAYY